MKVSSKSLVISIHTAVKLLLVPANTKRDLILKVIKGQRRKLQMIDR